LGFKVEEGRAMTCRSLLVVVSLALAACVSHAAHIRGPDGEDNWVSITCKRSQANCIERAGEECPNGYTVADASGHEGFYAQGQGGFMPAYATTTYRGELLIKCT
jgi:hypothetical protein